MSKLKKEDENLTCLLKFDNDAVFAKNAEIAGDILKKGGLVAMPTETVYGLGANALDETAVKNIFKAKGRPSDNPLIVHVADFDSVKGIVKNIPPKAKMLMEAFWPGPINIIMEKSDAIPDCVSAGRSTVAVRMPDHKVALAIIKASSVPVAAPSANTSGKPSPTEARHVLDDMNGKIDIVADGGACEVGIESTVIDMTADIPVILRPGKITANMIREVIGEVFCPDVSISEEDVPKCPGMKYTHYSPEANVYVVECDRHLKKETLYKILKEFGKGKNGILDCGIFEKGVFDAEYIDIKETSEEYANGLFGALREFDEKKTDTVFALICFNDELSNSVRNRLYKSAGNKIIRADEVK